MDSHCGGVSGIRSAGVFMGQGLEKIIKQRKSAIVKKWFDLTAQSYAPDTAEFIKTKKDRFTNPVGGAMRSSLEGLLNQLIHSMDPKAINTHLDPVIRIRAVQNFSPSQATEFILALKTVCRENLIKELRDANLATEFINFEAKIDTLCLMAFDIYMQCREKIFQISANETRNRTFRAFERAGLIEGRREKK
jgi:hypothetical protein